jgi:hypothetical protein
VDFLEGSGGGDKVVVFYYIGNLEETGVPGKKHPPAASHCQTLSHNVVPSTPCH